MAETLDELTYDHEEEGVLVRKQLDRTVLAKGGWATVMFLFQELDRKIGRFRPPKMAVVRFRKSGGSYRKHSSFNISSAEEARRIAAVFESWAAALGEDADREDTDREDTDREDTPPNYFDGDA